MGQVMRIRTPSAPDGVPGLRRRHRDESGATAIELALYTPLIMMLILASVQFGMIYLGHQVASGAAREGNRVARVTGSTAQGTSEAEQSIAGMGSGVLENTQVVVEDLGGEMRTTVSGSAASILPFVDPPVVTEVVRGPVEQFQFDD
jgi:Flp pilus assembly protein TadG